MSSLETIFGFEISATVALITLFVAFIVRRMTRGRTNKLFLTLIMSVLLSSILNICDSLYGTILEGNAYNLYLRYLINYAYFAVRNCSPVIFVAYVCSYLGIWYHFRNSKKLLHLWELPFLFEILLLFSNIFTKKVFYFDDAFVYRRGSYMIILYLIAFYYIVMAMIILMINRKLIVFHKFLLLFSFLPITSLCVMIQMFFPNVKADNFASAILLLAIALEVQRPEEVIDYVVDCESLNSFVTDTNKMFMAKTPKCVLFLKIINHSSLRNSLGFNLNQKLLCTVSKKIYQMDMLLHCSANIYYLDQGTFAVSVNGDKYELLQDLGRLFAAFLQDPIKMGNLEVMIDPRLCIVRYPEDISSKDSYLNFAHTFFKKIPQSRKLISIDTVSDSKDFKLRNELDTIIKRGIEKYNFQMYYQPIYSVEKKKFISAEALIRLIDDEYGFVSPALFIPSAEESGAIHQIGDFVLEDVFRFIGSNDFKSLGLEYIEINLSVAQCIEPNLYEKTMKLMEKYGVKPEQVNLEITETGVDMDPDTTDRNIALLAMSGISFSLDDYGTGYSNITRVVSLPLDIVKLDKSLVDEMDSPMMWTVIRNTVDMLHRMNKKILVEGVEDKHALEKFEELGCDYIQGYYFSKPLNESSFLKFVMSKNFGIDI